MKFDVDDKNRCRLVCVKFHLNRCRFAVAVAKCLGGSLFWDTVYIHAPAEELSGIMYVTLVATVNRKQSLHVSAVAN